MLASCERAEELGVVVEVVLDGGLAAAGDEQDLLDAVRNQFFDHVLHDGLARDGQHFLGLRLGGRQKPRPISRNRNDCALDHHLNIAARERYSGAKKEGESADMEDIQQQLPALRRRMARIDRKYAQPAEDAA